MSPYPLIGVHRGDPVPYSPRVTDTLAWSKDFKQSVALLVDELVIMCYQSGLDRADDYTAWVAYQVQNYAKTIDELNTDTSLTIGIPTYPMELPAHDPEVENVISAIAGVKSGLIQAGDASNVFQGLSIYAEWTTTPDEVGKLSK